MFVTCFKQANVRRISYYSQRFQTLCVDVSLERETFRIEVRYTLPVKDFEFTVSGLTIKSSTSCVCSSRHLIPLGANIAPCSSSFKWEVFRAWICISKAEEIYRSAVLTVFNTLCPNQSSTHGCCTVICSPFST